MARTEPRRSRPSFRVPASSCAHPSQTIAPTIALQSARTSSSREWAVRREEACVAPAGDRGLGLPNAFEDRLRREIGGISFAVGGLDNLVVDEPSERATDRGVSTRRRRPFDLTGLAASLDNCVGKGREPDVEDPQVFTIMDVGAWLRSLGLAQYEALFRRNDIDAEVLGDLTDADLEKVGLTLGHRKRLLKAIASLDGTEPVAKPTSPAPPYLSTEAAERRPITVMFCDLVGSTSLAARLDAEDWRNLSRRGLRGGHRTRRPCAEEARRRADGPVWLSAGAGE